MNIKEAEKYLKKELGDDYKYLEKLDVESLAKHISENMDKKK